MDAVVTGAWGASVAGQGGVPDRRTLLVDCMVTEPMGVSNMREHKSSEVAGAAAAAGHRSKEQRYGALVVVDTTRQLLLPWVVETWGRHDPILLEFLKGTARVAAYRVCGRESCSSDGAEQRRDARVAGRIFTGWVQRLSAGVAQAMAEHLDGLFNPVGGTVARSGFGRWVPSGAAADAGLVGVTGHVRNSEPRFAFSLATA